MKTILSSLILFLFVLQNLHSQNVTFSSSDHLIIQIDPLFGKYYNHKLKPKQTIYSLSRIYNTSVNQISLLNDKKAPYHCQIGEVLKIPFNKKSLIAHPSYVDLSKVNLIPVYYNVQQGDNLFRISRYYFSQSIIQMMKRNKLQSSEISLNQVLHVGWLPILKANSTTKDFYTADSDNSLQTRITNLAPLNSIDSQVVETDSIYDLSTKEIILLDTINNEIIEKNQIYSPEAHKLILKSNKGIALWNKNQKDKEHLFVLHKSARVNSIIELYYPLLKRRTFARVVANFPKGIYPDEVSIVISPKVAESLGVLDERFLVEMKYYE